VSSPTQWSAGRYDAVGDRIAPIAEQVVSAAKQRGRFGDVVDLACGTGSAALAAASVGARVTAVDITPELIGIGAEKAEAAGHVVAWVTGDAADTGLASGSFDAAVSNMGIIFVEPTSQVAEIARLLKSGGVLGFSSWVREPGNPFFRPIADVLGPLQSPGYTPDQWGQSDTIADRLAADFDDVLIESSLHTWQLGPIGDAMHWVTHESPIHVSLIERIDDDTRERLLAGFADEFGKFLDADGNVTYDAPYVVVTALRR
jgi:ubiquinone/menaquinone biosynthesis C-methylase UbiE